MLFSNLPIRHSQQILFQMAHQLGRPIAYEGERNGAFIHDIQPDPQQKGLASSSGFDTGLALHTEMAFHPIKPNYILLFCIKNPGVPTFLVSMKDILQRVDASTRCVLGQDGFKIHPPVSFTNTTFHPYWQSVVKQNTITMAQHCLIEFKNDMYKDAYTNLTRQVEKAFKTEIVLRPGDLLVIDNTKYLHGRPHIPFCDRLLKRMYVL